MDWLERLRLIVLCAGIAVFLFLVGVIFGSSGGYRRGQIDAANGHMEYVLTTQPNGERTWGESK